MNEGIVGSGGTVATDTGPVEPSNSAFAWLFNATLAPKNTKGTKSSVQVFEANITGKTLAKYQRGYMLNLPGTGPWDIKITRTTADATKANVSNEIWWSDYVEIINAKLNYPNSAMIYTAIDAEQFSSIPSRSFEIYGIKCKIPSNYDQATRTYSGFWDGTFVTEWTDNPAWVFYDLVTSTRYGLGDVVSADLVDKWTLYSIAQYCDGLVPDGKGAFEPRFTCNLYLQTREDAYKVVANLASIFRGMVFWATGLVTASQDAPRSVDAIYTAANVIDGAFSYTGTSAKTRHNVVLVSWNNPENGYALEIEYIEDAKSIIENGIIQTEISAMGCTSQGQAHRLGKWLLYTEQNETETVSFKAGLDGLISQPGDIIQTQDPFRSGKRLGGRVVSVETVSGISATITIDSTVLFEVGKVYTALLTSTDGTIVSHTLSNPLDNTYQPTLNISTTELVDIQVGSVWVVAVSDLSLQSWRVVSVSESTKGSVDITALMYNPDKYAAIEYNLNLIPKTITSISLVPSAVDNVTILEHMYVAGTNRLSNKLSISWISPDRSIDTYIINYTKTSDNNNPKYLTVNIPNVEIEDIAEGEYTIGVVSVNALGVKSAVVSTTYTVVGKTVNPADILNFTSYLSNDSIILSWSFLADLDIDYYEVRYGTSWGTDDTTSAYVYRGIIPSVTLPKIYASGLSHKFFIKAVDTSGNWSASYTLDGTLIDNITAKILLTKTPIPSILPVLVANSTANTTMTITPPNNVTDILTDLDTNVLKISWTNVTIPTDGLSFQKYVVYINDVKFTETTANKVEYTWLDKGLTKVIRVTTVDLLGTESLGTALTKTVAVPNIISNLTATLVGTQVNLAWAAAIVNGNNVDTKSYRIYVGNVAVAEVATLNYSYAWTDKDLSKTFAVETVDYINNVSAARPSTTMAILNPFAPTDVQSTISGTSLNTTWTHSVVSGNRFPIAKYNIYFGDIGNPIKLDEVVANSYIQEWTYGNTTKAIQVEAVDALGNVSSKVSYTTTIVAPNAPSSLNATLKSTTALFTWSPATVATNSLPIQYYELREGGTNWASATFVANIPVSAEKLQYLYGIITTTELASTPIGTMKYDQAKVFRIASKDINGIYSITSDTFGLTITKPTALADMSLNIAGAYINAAWTPIIQGTGLNAFTLPVDRYEIRTTRSSTISDATWAASTQLASLSGATIALDPPINPSIDPLNNATGTWYYLIRAYDIFGAGGAIYNKALNIVAPSIAIGLNSKVIDNNILLLWEQPTTHSFPISTFMLKKSLDPTASYTEATTIGTKPGGFTNVFEESAGLYYYSLAGIDTAGNIGTVAKVSAQVNQPPDFVLTGDLFRDNFALTTYGSNTINSTRNNIIMSDQLGLGLGTNALLGPISSTQTFDSHFSRSVLLNSQDLQATSWAATSTIWAKSPSLVVAPDGTEHATQFTKTAVADSVFLRQNYTHLNTLQYTLSIWIYVPSGQASITNFRFSGDWADVTPGSSTVDLTTFNTWILVSSTATMTANRGFVDFNLLTNGGTIAPEGFIFHAVNAQEVIGDVPSTYWPTPQDQVTAGYPVYAQPSLLSGTLTDIIDYTSIITTNQYISLSLDVSNMAGTTGTYQVSIGTSSDGITYNTTTSAIQPATTNNLSFGIFALGFRYVKVIITVTSNTAGIDLIRINNYRVKLSLKYTNDGGSGTVSTGGIYAIALTSGGSGYTSEPAVAITGGSGTNATAYATISGGIITAIIVTNSGSGYTGTPTVTITGGGGSGYVVGTITKTTATSGSLVRFSYEYIDVNSIQVTYGGTTSGLAIYDFVDTPYPKFFRVLLFNSAGTPILGNFSWSAKGTI